MFFIIITLDFLKRTQELYLYFFVKIRLNKKDFLILINILSRKRLEEKTR